MPDTEAGLRAAKTDAVLVSLRSPAFSTRAPEFVAEELMPDYVRIACSAWQTRYFNPRDVRIRVLRDVIVVEEGLVFDRAGRVIDYSVRQHEPELIERARGAVEKIFAGAEMPGDDTPLILAKKRGAGNYGHWMIEILPMVHLVLSRLKGERIGVLLHDVQDAQLGGIIQDSLRRLGVNDQRIRVSGIDPVFVRELIMVEGMTDHGSYMSPLVQDCHERLAHGIAGAGIERVFLTRGAASNRQFEDEAALNQLAEARGFHVVSSADLGLDGQIALMRDARLVAGVMGAAMTNLIYARAKTRATLFAPAGMPDTFFWFIANLRDLRYREVRCAQPGEGEGWDRPLAIGQQQFADLLDEDVESLQ